MACINCNINTNLIKCCYCDNNLCYNCFKTYAFDSINIHCTKCKRNFDAEYLITNLGKDFSNEYKIHQQNLLFETELVFMPATMRIFEQYSIDERLKKLFDEYDKEISLLKTKINEFGEVKDLDDCVKLAELHSKSDSYYAKIYYLKNMNNRPKNSFEYIRKCSNCNIGFINSSNYTCGLCNSYACPKCFKIKTENHVCDNIKQFELKCPKCSNVCYKIDDYKQSYCNRCAIIFNWKTKEIRTSLTYNPYVSKYSNHLCSDVRYNFPRLSATMQEKIFTKENGHTVDFSFINVYKSLIDIEKQYSKYKPAPYPNFYTNIDVRMDYMRKKISIDDFKNLIIKQYTYPIYIHMIIDTLNYVLSRILQQYVQSKSLKKSKQSVQEVKDIVNYVNNEIKFINASFGITVELVNIPYLFKKGYRF